MHRPPARSRRERCRRPWKRPNMRAPKPLGGLGKSEETRAVIAVDPAIDGNTGQQTLASKALDARLLQRAADKFTQFEVVAVSAGSLGKAQFLLAGTLTPLDAGGAN